VGLNLHLFGSESKRAVDRTQNIQLGAPRSAVYGRRTHKSFSGLFSGEASLPRQSVCM